MSAGRLLVVRQAADSNPDRIAHTLLDNPSINGNLSPVKNLINENGIIIIGIILAGMVG